MHISLLCYKPAVDGKCIDNLIDWYTFAANPKGWRYPQLRTSHSEIMIPEIKSGYLTQWSNLCYTSTVGQIRNKGAKYNGTCCRLAGEVITHQNRWYYYEFKVNEEALAHALTWADLEIAQNRGYDLSDIAKYFLPVRHQNITDHRFICSGFSWAILFKIAVYWREISLKTFAGSDLSLLSGYRLLTDLPSPFRLSLWCKEAGLTPREMETDKDCY